MGIREMLQKRRDDVELGHGLWRRAHDRFVRGIDRFHQILEKLPSDDALQLIVPEANKLSDLLPRVRSIAVQAQQLAPSTSLDVPASPTGTYSNLQRTLSKAGNSVAQCAEALAMLRSATEPSRAEERRVVVARRVQTVIECVEEAERYVEIARAEKDSNIQA